MCSSRGVWGRERGRSNQSLCERARVQRRDRPADVWRQSQATTSVFCFISSSLFHILNKCYTPHSRARTLPVKVRRLVCKLYTLHVYLFFNFNNLFFCFFLFLLLLLYSFWPSIDCRYITLYTFWTYFLFSPLYDSAYLTDLVKIAFWLSLVGRAIEPLPFVLQSFCFLYFLHDIPLSQWLTWYAKTKWMN